MATSRLSGAFAEADLPLLGMWAWQRDYLDAEARRIMISASSTLAETLERHTARAGRLLRLALEGGQWALTPSIPVQFIHAVQQPIGLPRFLPSAPDVLAVLAHEGGLSTAGAAWPGAPLVALREARSPDALLIGGLDIHLASTGRVDLAASWREVEDDQADGVRWIDVRATPEPILLGTTAGSVPAQGTSGREVATITEVGSLAFLPRHAVDGVWRPPAAPVQRFGDTRHRIVTYAPVVTSRFGSDFPADAGLVFTRTGPTTTVSVPSSAPPPAPVIVSVLPSFGWQRERAGTLTASIRSGQGIRVYLERPWFASGEGERLGVVLWPRKSTPPTDEQRRDRYAGRVTEWGLDPLRCSGPLVAMPNVTQLRESAATREGVYCAEIGRSVDIVGYDTQVDVARGLRYADIVFAADAAYMPFVRLALVRFQADSIPGAEISAIATADFLQLTPDRAAMLIADPSLPNLYRLTISGLAPTPSPAALWKNRIEVTLEERIDDLATDLGWRPVAGGVAVITETTPNSSEPAVLYSGLVEFALPPDPNRYRLAIREFETWEVDPLMLQPLPLPVVQSDRLRLQGWSLADAGDETLPILPGQTIREQIEPTMAAVQPAGVSATLRAIGRLDSVFTGPRTRRRLVYAEFLAIDPPARNG
ncbi:hypothetical protein LGR54_23415 [Ancylobacter sp. Lp-2]|uniref:hypothetical protein n=1 Tax=Ancylobacter sp. Lp-2 TaxID=2881339 RepID=UPI001E52ED49|nr:hypothetical protein [Ancylobacter sp. Lp-2]MCB4771564.1 hypothetical protein [Ancylobacter sp. Lp-2]